MDSSLFCGSSEEFIEVSEKNTSKIISIADAYDSMISDRPYRKGLFIEVAKKELIDNSGSQFDSEMVTAFIKYLEENE